MSKPLTASALANMKRAAKRRATADSISYNQALELEAREAGFTSWHAALHSRPSNQSVSQTAGSPLEVDPVLPPLFDSCPNEERSEEELARWWKRPFAVTRADGGFTLMCLDGGAWDRPTFYGDADTIEEAAALARAKLARWEEFEDQPITTMDCDDNGLQVISFTIAPSRPGRPRPVLARLGPNESARSWLDNWNTFKANNPEAAKAQIRRARQQDEGA